MALIENDNLPFKIVGNSLINYWYVIECSAPFWSGQGSNAGGAFKVRSILVSSFIPQR